MSVRRSTSCSLTRLVISGVGEAVCEEEGREGDSLLQASAAEFARDAGRNFALGFVSGCSGGSARHSASASAERSAEDVHPRLKITILTVSAPCEPACSCPSKLPRHFTVLKIHSVLLPTHLFPSSSPSLPNRCLFRDFATF